MFSCGISLSLTMSCEDSGHYKLFQFQTHGNNTTSIFENIEIL